MAFRITRRLRFFVCRKVSLKYQPESQSCQVGLSKLNSRRIGSNFQRMRRAACVITTQSERLLQQVLANHYALHLVGALVDLGEAGDSSAPPIASTTKVHTSAKSVSSHEARLICRDEVGMNSSLSFDPLTRPVIGQCIWPPIGGVQEQWALTIFRSDELYEWRRQLILQNPLRFRTKFELQQCIVLK